MRLLDAGRGALRGLAWVSWGVAAWTLYHVGLFHAGVFLFAVSGSPNPAHAPAFAWWYVGGVLSIVAAHEFGHRRVARGYGLRTSGPFLFPWPLRWAAAVPWVPPLGLLGAVLPIHTRQPLSTHQQFDIAWAGVMHGAGAMLLCALVGAGLSVHLSPGPEAQAWNPHALRWLLGPGRLAWHPLLHAARVGWLITATNLLLLLPMADGWKMFSVLPKVWADRRWQVGGLVGLCVLCGW